MSTVSKRIKLLALSSFFLLITACQNEDTEAIDLTRYSGLWKGLFSRVQTGSCSTSSAPDSTRLRFVVLADGSFTAQQEWKDVSSGAWNTTTTTTWSGAISSTGDIALHRTFIANCLGVDTPGEADYSGKIVKTSNTRTLSIESDEIWCTDENCTFKVSYALQLKL